MERFRIDDRTHVLVLTGAGVSAESGVPTFRGNGGLWENHRVEEVASPEGFRADPRLVWRFYAERRGRAKEVHPNAGHRALAALEDRLGERFLLVTQNVDGLHRRAGSRRVVEIHGNLFMTRCSVCERPPFEDDRLYTEPPECDVCRSSGARSLLRPHIVWFGEMLDPLHLHRIDEFIASARGGRLVFLAAGTSGAVYPAAGLVDLARRAGGETWLVNADPPENVSKFDHFIQGATGVVLPELIGSGAFLGR